MGKRVLIVDDDPDVVVYLSTVLQDNGYQTLEAANGRAGLEKAAAERPDLILLDLMMPHKSGIALLGDLRQDAALRHIPVIMVTGVSGETGIDLQSIFAARSAGAADQGPPRPDGFLEKPVNPEKLLKLMKDILGEP